jgi:hypothetical protein
MRHTVSMAITSGSYGYIVLKGEWVLHEGIQTLLGIRREDVHNARMMGFHMLEAKILDDSGNGLLAEVELQHPDRNGLPSRTIKVQVLIPWNRIDGVVCFSDETFGEVKKGMGFVAAKSGSGK